jgi:hypothetical protein
MGGAPAFNFEAAAIWRSILMQWIILYLSENP